MYKSCSRCHTFKPLASFDHARNSRDGHHHRCKICDRKRDKERHKTGSLPRSIRRWKQNNQLATQAHKRVRQAVCRGELQPGPCAACGCTKSTRSHHAHHEDYTKPLDVTWLCPSCHIEHHRLERLHGKGQELFSFMKEGKL